ncbi:uncharacterized protein N7459_009015 [Penicillium hispanicum]|uniref:uncharacterized protein n=1 Tax=Penicillium hispanicum TaxID=1080232 RepID=UPI002540F3B7|nr:uncharacterized protein N7459_009015 [Penicillium hispanicum]KAJ5569585.1 hypothetical protein N7459_009015 [Penicillium hispanicum]
MDTHSSPDYKALFHQEREKRKQEEERRKHLEDRQKKTTLVEFLRYCHNVLSRPLRVRESSTSTKGEIPIPKGKHCPTRLKRWEGCAAQQQDIYNSLRRYLQPEQDAPRLFPSKIVLDGLSEHFEGAMGSEYDLQTYERLAVEDHTRQILLELCKIPAAQKEFGLGDGVLLDSHPNILNETENESVEAEKTEKPETTNPGGKPDQFFFHRVDNKTATLITTVEYKPPHKLPLADIHRGLCDMNLWKEMVWSNKVPRGEAESLVYNSQRLVCSAIVQEYHVMIQEGLEYSYLTTGFALILLWVPYYEPSTLCYYLCEPNQDVSDSDGDLLHPNTSIARVLCLCLMSLGSRRRDQEWRNMYCSDVLTWTTLFDITRESTRSQQGPPSDGTDYVSPSSAATSSEYQPSSSPVESTTPTRRVRARAQGGCAPSDLGDHTGFPESSDSETDQGAPGRKRGISQVELSPLQRNSHQRGRVDPNDIAYRQHAPFCSQRCLLGLRDGTALDDSCPNIDLHRQNGDGVYHPITATSLVSLLKQQMDEIIDRCIPFGSCGSYGAPFKLTCFPHGYTVVGKGTTSGLWKKFVSREAEIYHILREAQGSAVPVFFGTIDLAKIYFLHGAGQIRHMLVMGWAGESTAGLEQTADLRREIERSKQRIRALGVRHLDLRPDNILWNAELGRALIIDFHRSELDSRPVPKRVASLKRPRHKPPMPKAKRARSSLV